MYLVLKIHSSRNLRLVAAFSLGTVDRLVCSAERRIDFMIQRCYRSYPDAGGDLQ
jgi:hypothetical protein